MPIMYLSNVDGSKALHELSHVPVSAESRTRPPAMVWAGGLGKSKPAQRTDPYILAWTLQLPPA
jgi:hypothetical protein